MTETRKLAAILVADVVGYSRLAGADEDRTLARLRGLRSDLIDPAIAAHRGRIVKRTGDGSIIDRRLRSPSSGPANSARSVRPFPLARSG
jgi:adenylate cyclase